nr:MAG TPA: hypothetical protein [Bacteriophage sp.]DAV71186.1 MAG TPA: hypothetical protein [Bacteriophage sp.]
MILFLLSSFCTYIVLLYHFSLHTDKVVEYPYLRKLS